MNIAPTQSTLQAFGNTLSQAAPTAQTKVPEIAQTVERPAPNATQRADAAPRLEAPARPEADRAAVPSSAEQAGRRAARIDILV